MESIYVGKLKIRSNEICLRANILMKETAPEIISIMPEKKAGGVKIA